MSDKMTDEPQPSEADLARLADGSLPAPRRDELRARVERSPELSRALAEQHSAISLVRSADVRAPDALRMQVEAMAAAAAAPSTGPRSLRPRRNRADVADRAPRAPAGAILRRPRLVLSGAAALAAVLVALIVLASAGGGGSGSGSGSGPTLPQTASLALASATAPPPAQDVSDRSRLRVSVAGVAFPSWDRSIHWRTLGSRADKLAGRWVVTVFYGWPPAGRVGYSIVPGRPIPVRGGRWVTRGGVRFTFVTEGRARVVTWVQSGHTCVIAGRAITDQVLLKLAAADTGVRVSG